MDSADAKIAGGGATATTHTSHGSLTLKTKILYGAPSFAGAGMIMNCPFPAGSGRKEIVGAFEQLLVPAAKRVKPELVLISAGFDSRIDDPLGHFLLHDAEVLQNQRRKFLGFRMVPRHVDPARIHDNREDQLVDLLADDRGVSVMLQLVNAAVIGLHCIDADVAD